MRSVRIDRPSYLLGAVVAEPSTCDALREQMLTLPRRGPKLHWRDLDDRARRTAIDAISGFDAYHMVVVAAPVDPRRQERARAYCLERLAWHLDGHGVKLLTLEARPSELMKKDRRTIDVLRSKHALPEGLRVDHAQPSTEPMLWIADQVLGALGESLVGGRSDWFDAVRRSTTVDRIEL
ncbi:hypothetical protein JCM13591A_35400 [Microbacterium xylanilyticum]